MESIFLEKYPFADPTEENWHFSNFSRNFTKKFLIFPKNRKNLKVYKPVEKFN